MLSALLLRGAWASATVAIVQPRDSDPVLHLPPCPPGRCEAIVLEDLDCADRRDRGGTLVLTGHSGPPLVLGQTPEAIGELVACLDPGLLVLDTCYGFSAPLLAALADRGLHPLVVGTTDRLSVEGLRYDAAFFTEEALTPERRAGHVHARYGEQVLRWVPDGRALAAGRDLLSGWAPEAIEARLQRVWPNLVRVPVAEGPVEVLYEVGPEHFAR